MRSSTGSSAEFHKLHLRRLLHDVGRLTSLAFGRKLIVAEAADLRCGLSGLSALHDGEASSVVVEFPVTLVVI